jgi:hypothetical protein
LEAAVGFFGDGAFDQTEIQKLIDAKIELAGNRGVAQGTRQLGF